MKLACIFNIVFCAINLVLALFAWGLGIKLGHAAAVLGWTSALLLACRAAVDHK